MTILEDGSRRQSLPEHRVSKIQTIPFLGLQFFDGDQHQLLAHVRGRANEPVFRYMVTPNANDLYLIRTGSDEVKHAFLAADIHVLDSRFLARLARLLGLRPPPVIAGSDFIVTFLDEGLKNGDRLCVIGGNEEVIEQVKKKLPHAHIEHVNVPFGFMTRDGEAERVCTDIVARNCRYFVFCISGPNQQILAHRIRESGRCQGFAMCLGGAVNFYTGRCRRAPVWMRSSGLEWLFRLVCEPRRLLVRYLVHSPTVLKSVFREAFRSWTKPTAT